MAEDRVIKLLHQQIINGASVCTDSRIKTPNGLFFALKGENFDGNDFAEQALNNGCQYAVVDNAEATHDTRFLLVNDVLTTLQKLARRHRDLFQLPVIGITGSNGKTTTKELICTILSKSMKTFATEGNLNNHIGVPLTILSFTDALEMAVVEMGANHMNEIGQLCEIAKPHYGLITNIGKAHLEGFGSFERIITAKKELYDYIDNHNGLLFVNGDNELLERLSKSQKRILYGENTSCHCIGTIISSHPFLSISFVVNKTLGKTRPGNKGIVNSKLSGKYNFENILAAIAISLYFGVSIADIIQAIEHYQPSNNRSQLVDTKNNRVILDAYNANPSSMAASVDSFSQYKDEGKTAVFIGDMLELGEYASQEHDKIFQLVKDKQFNLSVFVGKIFSDIVVPGENTYVFSDANTTSEWLKNNPVSDYCILVKGSRGIKMETIIKHL